ncbi:hypothetical protein FA09DRAFT_342332 [Tilletiopsis washingtonensis]|uniref:Autophagy-related protein 3 n=1 Tax=Tilletiopsis washingtonensis TaxID=58919 RepID=A0A316ZIA4_9BASI|nr:hypothetical protein FA09DRAFT_342332 [Tilletiopsis washingtonensis]PWO01017.1 hypothetical protein FA09DRAFT_342332 [Tilletiopsis washingtonensis]
MNTLQTHFWAVRDYLAPVLRESKFKEHGRITPDEFVAAGDFLAYKFPTWTWCAATSPLHSAASSAASSSATPDARYTRDFLPPTKQYLISRGVPCVRRAAAVAEGAAEKEEMLDIPDDALTAEDEALATRIADLQLPSGSSGSGHAPQASALPEMDDIPDMDDEDDELGGLSGGVDEAEDAATASAPAAAGRGSKLLAVRTYDCLITYDKYYQVPRMWLVGYSESGSLLSAQQIFEDISPDYAQKTVTVEPFPHAPLHTASVHPCKHASVMRKVIERMDGKVQEMGRSERKKWKLSGVRRKEEVSEKKDDEEVPEGLRVDQYLLVFLKFMASIVPAIEIDATQAV